MKRVSLLTRVKGLSKGKKIALGITTFLIVGFVGLMATPTQGKQVTIETNTGSVTEKVEEAPVKEEISQVMYNENGIKIDFKGVVKTNTDGAKIKIFIENNSDISKTIQVRDLSINGYMISGICSANVEPGKKSNSQIEVLGTYLKENGIEKIDSIELKFAIINTDDILTQYETDTISITL